MPKSKFLKKRRSAAASRRLRRNPDGDAVPVTKAAGASIMMDTAAALGGYAITRLISRIAYSQALKRWPALAEHGKVLSSALAFGAVWLLGGYWRSAAAYHAPAIIGAGIAAAQTAIQTYVPKFGWMLSDCNRSDYAPQQLLTPVTSIDDGSDVVDDQQPTDLTASGTAALPDPSPAPPTPAADSEFADYQSGIFSPN